MRLLIFLSVALLYAATCEAQNDLLIVKKNHRTIQSFYPGTEMNFSTDVRYYEGQITDIKRDSVFFVQYDIRHVYSPNLGVFLLDTVSEYHFAVNYKNIISLGKSHNNFDWNASGGALLGGGALITTAGLISWIFAKPNTRYYARPSLVIGAAALAGVGYILLKTGNKSMKLGKKYTLHYIKLK